MTYDDLLTTAGGVPLILADLRARALAGGGGTPAPRAAIGSNLKLENRPLLADLFADVTWQNENASYAYTSPPTDAPASSRYYLNLQPPFADGEWHVMHWREPGNATGVSKWARQYTNALLEPGTGTRFTDVAESYANGLFSARFRYYARTAAGNNSGLIRWAGQGTIQLLSLRPESLAATELFNPLVVQVSSERRGNIRALDGPFGGGNFWSAVYLWSERSRIDPDLNRASKQPGMAWELWRNLAILTNRDLEIIITHRIPESTVKALMRAFMTGDGFEDGKPLPLHLNLYVELCSNESWNPRLTGAYQDLVQIGGAMGKTGGENYQRLFAQQARCRDVSRWIAEAVPSYMDRIIRIIGLSPENDLDDYISLTEIDETYFEAVSKSLYLGLYAKANYGGNTPAEIAPAWSADAIERTDRFIRNGARYLADGKRILCYEVGSDTGSVAWTNEQRAAWLESPQFRAIYLRELTRAATFTKDRMNLYWDFGSYLSGAREGAWAHWQGPGKNNQKWDVANEVQAQLDQLS